jgi:hypothetical protein
MNIVTLLHKQVVNRKMFTYLLNEEIHQHNNGAIKQ